MAELEEDIEPRIRVLDPQDKALLLSVCSALGGVEPVETESGDIVEQYVMGDECLQCLKDIKNWIARDDQHAEKFVLQALYEWRVLEKDLIPILLLNSNRPEQTHVEERLALACVELICPMTWPISASEFDRQDLLIHGKRLSNILTTYKETFVQPEVLEAILKVAIKPLTLPPRNRTDRDGKIIRIVLSIVRNLLAIEDPTASSNDPATVHLNAMMQDLLVQRLHETDMIEMCLTMASNADSGEFREFNLILQEIFYHLFLPQNPEGLFSDESAVRLAEIDKLLQEEKSQFLQASRNGSSRHNKFGGTISLRYGRGSNQTISVFPLRNMKKAFQDVLDMSVTDTTKRVKGRVGNRKKELDLPIKNKRYKQPKTIAHVSKTALDFLNNSFNAIIDSVGRDIRAEREYIRETDYEKFFYLQTFCLRYRHAGAKVAATATRADTENEEELAEFDYDLVASSLKRDNLGSCLRRLRNAFDDKKWDDVGYAVDCLRQMLLTLDEMSGSNIQDYKDVADNLLSNLFYEQSTLDMFVEIARAHKTQSRSYLESIIFMIDTLLTTLEHYCKSKKAMFVRKQKRKTRARRKSQAQELANPHDEDHVSDNHGTSDHDEENNASETLRYEDMDDGSRYQESLFLFENFESSFASDVMLRSYCDYLEDYKDLSEEGIMCVVRIMHRIMVRCKREALFFQASKYHLSILELFHRICDDLPYMPKTKAYRELSTFIRFCLRQLFKKLEEYPLLYVELVYPTRNKDVKRIMMGNESEDDVHVQKATKKQKKLQDVELEIIPSMAKNLNWSQKIGVVVSALMEQDLLDLIRWVILKMTFVVGKREAEMTRRQQAKQDAQASSNSMSDSDRDDEDEGYSDAVIEGDLEVEKEALQYNASLKLLLNLLKFEKNSDADPLTWRIPGTLTSHELSESIKVINEYIEHPMRNDGKPVADLLQKRRKRARKQTDDTSSPKQKQRKRKADQSLDDSLSSGDKSDDRDARTKTETTEYRSAEFVLSEDDQD